MGGPSKHVVELRPSLSAWLCTSSSTLSRPMALKHTFTAKSCFLPYGLHQGICSCNWHACSMPETQANSSQGEQLFRIYDPDPPVAKVPTIINHTSQDPLPSDPSNASCSLRLQQLAS
jgi:hypothetical protein